MTSKPDHPTSDIGALPDELTERLAAEAERGYDVDQLQPRPRRSTSNEAAMNGFDPDHHFYGPDGSKITETEWTDRFARARTAGWDEINGFRLMTMYHGFVDYCIPGARLFGTALTSTTGGPITEIEVYDSEADALAGHARHRQAIQDGFHCDQCRNGLPHVD